MSVYKGKPVAVKRSAAEISDKFADLTSMSSYLDRIPEAQRAQIPNIEFGKDFIAVDTPQVGQLKFQVTERTPQRIVMQGVGTPVPVNLNIDMQPKGEETEVQSELDIQIPTMLRAFVGPQLQKAVDQISTLIGQAVNS